MRGQGPLLEAGDLGDRGVSGIERREGWGLRLPR